MSEHEESMAEFDRRVEATYERIKNHIDHDDPDLALAIVTKILAGTINKRIDSAENAMEAVSRIIRIGQGTQFMSETLLKETMKMVERIMSDNLAPSEETNLH